MDWRTWLRLGRVSNLPTVWTNALAGLVLADAPVVASTYLQLAFAFSLFYVGGMFLNDAFDRKIDAVQRPERPIPSGVVSARGVFVAGFGLLALGLLGMVMAAGPGRRGPALLAGGALGAVIALYDLWHKGNPLSPVLMGVARALVYIGAAAAVVGRLPTAVVVGGLVLVAYLIGLTYTAKQESLGRVGNWWPIAFLAAPLAYAAPLLTGPVTGALLYLLLAAWVTYALTLLVRSPRRVPLAVVSLIAGISLVDATLIALHGAPMVGWLAVAGFALTLMLQRVVPGT